MCFLDFSQFFIDKILKAFKGAVFQTPSISKHRYFLEVPCAAFRNQRSAG